MEAGAMRAEAMERERRIRQTPPKDRVDPGGRFRPRAEGDTPTVQERRPWPRDEDDPKEPVIEAARRAIVHGTGPWGRWGVPGRDGWYD